MAAVTPVSEVLITVDRAAVDARAPIKAAIDRGCSLSKFLYIAKDADEAAAHYTFHCALFRNEDFEAALHFLKEHAALPPQGKLRVTGAGCDMYKEQIEQVLGLEIEFIREMSANCAGMHFLISHAISPDDLFYPKIESQQELVERPPDLQAMIEKMRESLTANNGPDPNAKFPCLFLLVGSASVCQLVRPDGSGVFLSMNLTGGKSLLGLGKALVDTNNYDEIMALAEKGCVTNIDTTVDEFLKDDPNSPYGRFPRELPLFSFGKMTSSQLPLESYEREDRAIALVRLMAMNIHSLARAAVAAASVTRVVIGGNGVRSEVIRRLIMDQEKIRGTGGLMDVKFLKTGHTGAFGTMMSTDTDPSHTL